MQENYGLILKNVSKHIDLNEDEISYFFSLLEPNSFSKKQILLQPGEICKTDYFITKGCLRIYTMDVNGSEHIVMFGIEDWWAGDLSSFLTQTPATYYIDALEDTEVLELSKPKMDELYEKVPKFERFFRIIIQNALISQERRINHNLSLTAEQRYLEFVKKYPTLEQRIPQKQVAAYLGITPEFLSSLRRKLLKR